MILQKLIKYFFNHYESKTIDFTPTHLIDLKSIESMENEINASGKNFQPSNLWNFIGKKQIDRLNKFGFNNFKRLLVMDYGFFSPFPEQIFIHLLSNWKNFLSINIIKNLKSELGIIYYDGFYLRIVGFLKIYFIIYIRIYYELTKRNDKKNLINILEEPKIGNPLIVDYDNKKISFDLCYAINEYYSILQQIKLDEKDPTIIGELGAGYGRLAYVFLKTINCKYVISDISPTLYVSQSYFYQIFSDKKIFKFRSFSNYEEIKKEFEESDICFLTPNQLELLPPKFFNLFINISSLHEMRSEQRKNYHLLIDKITKNYFFSKQYTKKIKLPSHISEAYEQSFDEYDIPKSWKIISKRKSFLNPKFTETMFKIS